MLVAWWLLKPSPLQVDDSDEAIATHLHFAAGETGLLCDPFTMQP